MMCHGLVLLFVHGAWCMSVYGAASFSGPVSCSWSASVAYRSSYGVATYFSCPVTTDLVRYRVWDPGQINKWRLGCSGSRCQ